MSKLEKKHRQTFENIRRESNDGGEYWWARELQVVLEYKSWDKFKAVIHKATKACFKSKIDPSGHFDHVDKMVTIGSGAKREKGDVKLSRYACYLIVQNGNPAKPVIASGQTYFAIQTRRQELADEAFQQLDEDENRLAFRKELKKSNKNLGGTANQAGVKSGRDFAIFQNHGYQGLYGGLGVKDIHRKKGLKKSQKILDYMGSTELAANLFRATQAEEKLRREGIKGKEKANTAHHEVGEKVRKSIRDIGGTMPEDLPTPETSVKVLESKSKKQLVKE